MKIKDKRYESVISAAEWLVNTLSERGLDPMESDSTWERRAVQNVEALIKIAAEESYIVKAARVLAQSPYSGVEFPIDSDLGRLIAEVARAGAPPYEVGTGTATETDWVAPLRAELTQRNN